MASVPQASIGAARQELYRRMDRNNLAPLWEVLHDLIPSEPATPSKPALWKYREARPYLMEAGKLITAKEAIRRVLILENPGMRGESCITQSLYAGLQLILPGEIAPSHRHSQSALRFIVEGSGAYTAVDGERTTMHPGDFIITPSWTYHDHGNPGSEPVVWMDGLDIRMWPRSRPSSRGVSEEIQPVRAQRGRRERTLRQWASCARDQATLGKTSPIFNYRTHAAAEALEVSPKDQDPDPATGWKMQFTNPLTAAQRCPRSPSLSSFCPRACTPGPTAAPTAPSIPSSKARAK